MELFLEGTIEVNSLSVRVVKFSVSDFGIPLITVHMRYWRGIHSELMTHRAFSRNARSSRAVPVHKMLEEVKNYPFVPKHWGSNQKGMQAGSECNAEVNLDELDEWYSREGAWVEASKFAAMTAKGYSDAGYHKQVANRLLEPFMMIDTLVTSTDWSNFMALRDHSDAEPHMRDLAVATFEAFRESRDQIRVLKPGQWHLPYVTPDEENELDLSVLKKISAARCARISLSPFDGNGSVEAEVDRYDKLVSSWPVHASPVEHQATPDDRVYTPHPVWEHPREHRNFRGWRQNRAMIPNETVWDDDEWVKELMSETGPVER